MPIYKTRELAFYKTVGDKYAVRVIDKTNVDLIC